jgi:hypothetical protein
MTPKKILIVADFDRKGLSRKFFSVEHKLSIGLTRLGHHVVSFSDRDAARDANFMRSSRFGKRGLNKALLSLFDHLRPDIAIFGHSDLVTDETFSLLGIKHPRLLIAQFNVDPTDRPKTMAEFSRRAAHCVCSFITTAEPRALAALVSGKGAIAFFPNPVERSIETARSFAVPRDELAVDAIFLGTGIGTRTAQINSLHSRLPNDVRRFFGGGVNQTPRLASTAFLDKLATAAQSPNLSLDDGVPVPFLYSSDRVALLLGQGLLVHTVASGRLEALYEDGVVPFTGPEELANAITVFTRDDDRRRRVAEIGWRIAHERTSAERVAKYMIETILGAQHSEDYQWPTDLQYAHS